MAADRRILVRVDGGPGWGLGHLTRMRWLGTAAIASGAEVVYATAAGSDGERLLAEWGLCIAPVAADELVPSALLASFQPSAIVIDRLEQGEPLRLARRATAARIVCFDDVGAGLELADAVVNAIVFHWGRYDRSAVRARLYEGPSHMILAPHLLELAERPRSHAVASNRALIAFGGNDDSNLAPRVIEALAAVPDPLALRINLGPACRNAAEVGRAAQSSPHQVELVSTGKLAEELAAADLLVCAGGIMLYEAALCGVPAAAIAAIPDERRNIAYWASRGTAVDLGWERELEPARVAETVAALLGDGARREAMARAGTSAVDGGGLERCLAIVEGRP